jgi:hypothetical protein
MQLGGMEQPTNLRSLDLNLLVNLEALIATRSITRAAQKVGISQSTMSHALQRLRQTFNDEIVRRSPQGMVATQRALQLAQPIRAARSSLWSKPAAQPLTLLPSGAYVQRPLVDQREHRLTHILGAQFSCRMLSSLPRQFDVFGA